jgi:hypothetical protein
MADLQQLLDVLNDINMRVQGIASRQAIAGTTQVIVVSGLSDITPQLGLITAGEFRAGNGREPGLGFSGVRIAYPAMVYGGSQWHVVGINNDILQFGLRATDGVALAGGGVVTLDANGISISVTTAPSSVRSIKFLDGATEVGVISSFDNGTTSSIDIGASRTSRDTRTRLISQASSGQNAVSLITSIYNGLTAASVQATANSFGAEVDIEGNVDINGSIRISTALGARAYNSVAFTHNSTGNWLAVPLDSERFDTDGIHSTTTNTSRMTAQRSGVYQINGNIEFDSNSTGVRAVGIRLNGSTFIAVVLMTAVNGFNHPLSVSCHYSMLAGDYVELMAYQNSGGNLNVNATSNWSPEISMVRAA